MAVLAEVCVSVFVSILSRLRSREFQTQVLHYFANKDTKSNSQQMTTHCVQMAELRAALQQQQQARTAAELKHAPSEGLPSTTSAQTLRCLC